MRQDGTTPKTANDLNRYFNDEILPSQQETFGQIVVEILLSGRQINRQSICAKLLKRLELSTSAEQEKHHQALLGMLFGRSN